MLGPKEVDKNNQKIKNTSLSSDWKQSKGNFGSYPKLPLDVAYVYQN